MQITAVNWIMTLSLIGTFILLNIYENRKIEESNRRLEKDRHHLSYTNYIPERRSGYEMQKSDRRLEIDRRHFSYDAHIPERRATDYRRLSRS